MELSEKEKLELYDSYLCKVEYEFGNFVKSGKDIGIVIN